MLSEETQKEAGAQHPEADLNSDKTNTNYLQTFLKRQSSMIDYSVSARPNPRDREAAPKYYASPQVSENISMSEFCKHIASHGSVYSRADIQSVLTQAVDCMKEMLLDGKKIMLGDLGEFNIGLSSKGTVTADDFNPIHHIKKVHVNWTPGTEFINLKQVATFNLVTNRRAQRLLLKAVTSGNTTVDLTKKEEEEGGEDLTD